MPNDHYVPRFYLEHFAIAQRSPGKTGFWVYDKDEPADKGPRFQTPKTTAAIGDLYTFVDGAGGEIRWIESLFATLEGHAAKILDRWQTESAARPTMSEVPEIVEFVASLAARTPRAISVAKEFVEAMARDETKFLLENPDALQEAVDAINAKGGEDEQVDAEYMRSALAKVGTEIRLSANKKRALLQSLGSNVSAVMAQLLTMNWCICIAPTGSFFLTGDHPVCAFVLEPDGRAIFGGGYGLPNAQVTLPLSPDRCLLMDRQHSAGRMRVDRRFVSEINRRTAHIAERYVISPHDVKAVRDLMIEARRTRQLPKLDHEEIARSFKARRKREAEGND